MSPFRRLLARLVDRVAPLGFECPACGFRRGDHVDEQCHLEAHRLEEQWMNESVGERIA